MPAAYSIDLRKRVVSEINKANLPLKDISVLFNVNVKTIYIWRKNLKLTGSIAPKSGFHKGHSHKITNLEDFKKFIQENSDLTLKAMAEKWGNVSQKTIYRAMKKINFTFKKNNFAIKNAMMKKESSL